LQRLQGVFAPRSAFRAVVMPRGPVAKAGTPQALPRAKNRKQTAKTTMTKEGDSSPFVATAEWTSRDRDRTSKPAALLREAHELRRRRREAGRLADRVGGQSSRGVASRPALPPEQGLW